MDSEHTQGVDCAVRGGAAPAAEPSAGLKLGRYQLVKALGSGGMASVWTASVTGDYGFQRLFAVKMIRKEYASDPSFREMFLTEARVAASIRHANVLEVVDLGEQDSLVYQVMPLVDGESLAGLLQRQKAGAGGALPLAVVVRIVSDALRGLHAAHELKAQDGRPLGLVHRDVSPQNILVGIDGSTKIADFGIAKVMADWTSQTAGDSTKGKPSYSSPEQLRREPIDRRSDIFSAGIVLWEALTGKRLFLGADPVQVVAQILLDPLPDPRRERSDLPASVCAVVMKALQRERTDRYATADLMADALERAASECGSAGTTRQVALCVTALLRGSRPPTADSPEPLKPADHADGSSSLQTRARVFVIGIGVALLAMVGIAFVTWPRNDAAPNPLTVADAAALRGPVPVLAPAPPDALSMSATFSAGRDASSPAASSSPSARTSVPRVAPPKPSSRAPQLQFGNPYAQ